VPAWPDRAGETPRGAWLVAAAPGQGETASSAAAAPDLGALLVSSCAGCGGACGGHSVGMSGAVAAVAWAPAGTSTATPEQMAAYLTRGFWVEKGEIPHSWDTSASNVITVNLTGVSAGMKELVRAALEAWEAVADIDFREVSGTADITFTATGTGATTTAVYELDGDMVRATVNVSESWLAANGTTLGSYSMQTCIHEIGHALGLGHAGGYGLAGGTDFANDSWQMSVMSYTSQNADPTIEADRAVVVTPMMADIVAVQNLYGAPKGGATAGNTVYGKGATLETYLDDVFAGKGGSLASNAMTIFDEGGRDRIDLSGDTKAQRVDLNGGTYSDVYGLRGNLGIAKGTVIEDYVAGSAADMVTGNAAGNSIAGRDGDDVLHGRDGDDRLDGGSGADGLYGGNGTDRVTGHAGDDILRGDGGNDTVDGGDGNDQGRGDAGDDLLTGKAGDDRLYGGDGGDRLIGDAGNDSLFGDAGEDSVSGGAGHDTMTGGAGADIFVFSGGADRVSDFQDNADVLQIDDALFRGETLTVKQVLDRYAQVSTGVVVFDFGGGNVLTVSGVSSVSALADDLAIV